MSNATGKVVKAFGNLLHVKFEGNVRQGEIAMVEIGEISVKGEVIEIAGDVAKLQVFEDILGIELDSKVAFTFSIGMRNNPLWNEESTDSGFRPPIHGVQFCNNMEASRKAEWTTSMTLDALGMKSTGRKLPYYME